MGDLLKTHFDKFLLSFFVLYFSVLGWHAIFYLSHQDAITNPTIQAFMSAMLDNQKLVIGALLGLITGRAMASAKPNGGTNGTTTTTSTDTATH